MRLLWLVSAGVCALVVACSSGTHKKVLICDATVCNDEAGAAGTSSNPGTGPGEGGSGNEAGASADAGAPPQLDGGPDAGAPGDGGSAANAQLEVTLAGNGSVAVSGAAACLSGSCEYPLDDGSVLSLEAKPGPDSRFVGWSGACSGSDPKTTVTVSGLKSCIATFAIQRAVSATVDVVGNGTVTSNPDLACTALGCNGQVDDNSHVTLNALPASGFRFVSWSGSQECAGATQASLAILVTKDVACTAKFSKQFLLSISSAGADAPVSVTSGTCVAAMCTADADSSASFAANALAGYRFTGWSGDAVCTGTVDPLQIANISSDISCVANYAARFKVTGLVGSGRTGTVTATSGDVNATCSSNACIVDSGTSTTLVAPTIAGYRLTGWTGAGCTGSQSGNGLVVTPTTGGLTCTATYALGVSVTGTVVGATGTVTATSTSPGANCTAGGCGIDAGGSVTLTAPNLLPTFRFVNWTGDVGCVGAALSLALSNVTTSKSCKANYIQEFTILAKANAGGSATAAVGANACAGNSCTVDANVGVTLTANPDTANGYHFTGWSGASCTPAANNPLTVSNVNTTCTANFALNTFTIAATAGTNGGVTATRNDIPALCAGASCTVSFGTTVSLLATPAAHYHFVSWAGAGCTPTTSASLTLKNLNATCSAAFAIDAFSATVAALPAAAATVGITCPGNNCAAVGYNQLVNVTAVANQGWSFSGWSANCNGGTASPNAVTVVGTTSCVASFRPSVTGTVSPGATAGTITASGTPNAVCVNGSTASCIVDSGGTVTLTAAPLANSVFVNWTGGCTGTAATVMVSNVSAPVSCTANFYQLWAQATGGTGDDNMTNVTALGDGTVVGVGTSQLAGSRLPRLALVNLDANTGKLARNQLFSDTKTTGSIAPFGIATTSNQKGTITVGVHRAVGVSQNVWLHNEQAPAWEYEYVYPNAGTANAGGNVIATRDGGYAFVAPISEKAGVFGHLTKVDASGAVKWDTEFHATDASGAVLTSSPVDLLEDPAGKYFAILSSVQVGAQEQIMLAFINEDGTSNGVSRFANDKLSVFPSKFVVGSKADTFLVAGQYTDANDNDDGFYAELPQLTGKPTFAFTVGSASYETLNAVAVTPKGYALAGVFVDATTTRDKAWLLSIDTVGGIISDFGYSGNGTGDEQANAVFVPPAGGLVLAGSTSTWGAGLADMWTLRLNAAGAITFNAASGATRTAAGFARTALGLNPVTGTTLSTAATTVTRSAPVEVVATPGFAQNQQAP